MAISRSAAILLATATLMVTAPVAYGQPALSNDPPTMATTPSGTTATGHGARAGRATPVLPNTGMDAALELALAIALLGGGSAVRLGTRTLRE